MHPLRCSQRLRQSEVHNRKAISHTATLHKCPATCTEILVAGIMRVQAAGACPDLGLTTCTLQEGSSDWTQPAAAQLPAAASRAPTSVATGPVPSASSLAGQAGPSGEAPLMFQTRRDGRLVPATSEFAMDLARSKGFMQGRPGGGP